MYWISLPFDFREIKKQWGPIIKIREVKNSELYSKTFVYVLSKIERVSCEPKSVPHLSIVPKSEMNVAISSSFLYVVFLFTHSTEIQTTSLCDVTASTGLKGNSMMSLSVSNQRTRLKEYHVNIRVSVDFTGL